jgi:hypothetical protein
MTLVLMLALTIVACSGGDPESGGSDGSESSGDVVAEGPDACSLITAEEATTLAGYELEMGEDSILGCSYIPPGSNVADIVVDTAVLEGDATSVVSEGFPDATEIIPVPVGTDTVAVTTPSGDAIAAVVTGEGGRFVQLGVVFLLIDPEETERIEEVAQLAVTALERWDG